ncbi:MAG: hypothetical protein SW019_19485 [Actinomycetota bacterium]|nr:hypothetical protein [Actinomycetota bacterium]
MAMEWVAHVATATVGVAGIVGTWLTANRGLAHERRLATEARQQQRLENAYVDLLDVAERVGHWAQLAWPVLDTDPPAPVPEMPSLVEQAHTEALVRAFGSEKVLVRMKVWREILREMLALDNVIRVSPGDAAEARRAFDELRVRERDAREAIGDQVAVDLGHRPGS